MKKENAFGRDSSRRDFLTTCAQTVLGFTVIGLVAPLAQSCTDNAVSINSSYSGTFDVSALSTGSALMTTTNGADGFPIIIIRQSEDTFVALSSRCTHEGCQVALPAGSSITCPCHGARYDLQGNVTAGPAPAALFKYKTAYKAGSGQLTVTAS